MPLPADVKIPDRDELVKNSTWQERETDEFKHVHQPWALDTEEKKLAAYKELLGGDYHAVIMNSPGVAHLMAQGPEMSRMMAELKTNPKAIEKFILSGLPCGMVAMAALSQDLLRRRVLPPNKPEEKPLGPSEAKDYATKLFQCKKFAHAADQYAQAIAMVDQRPPVLFGVITDPDAPGGVKVTVKPRPAKALEDQKLLPSLYANLAACRVKQHRWPEVIGACDKSLKIEPMYTKAYLRRGEAKRRLKHYDEAVADGRSAIASAANDPEEKRADLIREAEQLIDSVQKEVAQRAADKKRQSMEKDGIELGEGDPIYGMDFDHILRRELRRLLPEPMVWIEEPPDTSEYGMRGKPENFVPKPRVGMCRVEEELPIDGPEFVVEASVRARGAKRFLYYMIDVDVPWRGICYETGGKPHWNHDVFRGKARVFNCNHYTEDTDWGMYVPRTETPLVRNLSYAQRPSLRALLVLTTRLRSAMSI